MNIKICKLTPDLVEDYVSFFDTTPHDDLVDEHKCYCIPWCNDDCIGDYESKNLSSREKRRDYAIRCVKSGKIQGYLAYRGDDAVGWCNANTKLDCLKCYGWRRYMGNVPVEEPSTGLKVKSIYCFMIAPQMKRKGIATRLMERVCEDAAQDGFDFVEAYPNKEFSEIYNSGPFEMYKKNGFTEYYETEQGFVMRKQLQSVYGMGQTYRPINIRLAVPTDAPDMAEVHMRSWEVAYNDIIPVKYIREKNAARPALYKRVITDENTNSYVIQYNGKIVGIMRVASPQDDDMGDNVYELHYIYLHPDFFRMGIGTQAMEFAFDIARSLGKTVMTVWVFAENANAIRFYAKCGFIADGKTKKFEYGRAINSIRMRKYL